MSVQFEAEPAFGAVDLQQIPATLLHELFERQAARNPTHIAVVCGDVLIRYTELNALADKVAGHLQRQGVGEGDPVGCCLPVSIAAVVSQLAVLKAGAVYVPLDPGQPVERLRDVISRARMTAIVGPESVRDLAAGVQVIAIDDEAMKQAVAAEPDLDAPRVDGSSLAYILPTSGSTGEPKLVQVEHRAIVNSTLARHHRYGEPPEHLLMVTPLVFDASLGGIWWCLSSGTTVELAPEGADAVVHAFDDALTASSPVTHVMTTPSLYRTVLPGARGRRGGPKALVLGGEPINEVLVADHFATFPRTRLFNEYGPTEAAVWCTGGELIAPVAGSPIDVSAGTPISGVEVLVVGEDGERVSPAGAAGEVCIAGRTLFRGYLGDPTLTAASLVPHPGRPGQVMYRTGDLGRIRDDGRLELLGRIDDQVKVRGYRIELGEIESALLRHPAVENAAVVVERDDRGSRLVGYVMLRQAGAADGGASGLRGHLASRLPGYMVPASFVVVDRLPLTGTGKIDRKALTRLRTEASSSSPAAAHSAASELEQRIAGSLAATLGVPEVAPDANFFELGGDSLLAVRAAHELRAALDDSVHLPVGAVFEAPTAVELARLVRDRPGSIGEPIPATDRTEFSFTSPQWLWWYVDHFRGPGTVRSSAFSVVVRYRIHGPFETSALEQALNALIDRHEPLRTAIDLNAEAGGVQRVLSAATKPLTSYDVSAAADPDSAAAQAEKEFLALPLDIGQACYIRAGVIAFGAEDRLLILRMHHFVTDDTAIRVIEEELSALYRAEVEGIPADLPGLPIRFRDFAVWQHERFFSDRQWLSEPANQPSLTFWRDRCSGLRPVRLPDIDGPTDNARILLWDEIDARTVAKARSLAHTEKTTLFAVLVTAYLTLIAEETGSDDTPILTSHACRHRPELERIVGLFFEPILIRPQVGAHPEFSERLRATRDAAQEAFAHLDIPVFALAEEIPELSAYLLDPFLGFELLPPASGLDVPNATVDRTDNFDEAFTGQPLTHPAQLVLTAAEQADGSIRLGLTFDPTAARRERMAQLLQRYQAILRDAVGHKSES